MISLSKATKLRNGVNVHLLLGRAVAHLRCSGVVFAMAQTVLADHVPLWPTVSGVTSTSYAENGTDSVATYAHRLLLPERSHGPYRVDSDRSLILLPRC